MLSSLFRYGHYWERQTAELHFYRMRKSKRIWFCTRLCDELVA
jgi:hypothetical protein